MTKTTIRVLHLASFSGNVGDILNHEGFYNALNEMHYDFEITPLEIRRFYRKELTFDLSFVEYANSFDCLIVGGGNYFELWVDHSPSGTSFMLPVELFNMIRVPVVFNALGVDPGQGASETNLYKFRCLLDAIFARKDTLVSVRNDGSMEALESLLGGSYARSCVWTPDAGFNVRIGTCKAHNSKRLLINLAGDMLEKRFPSLDSLSSEEFLVALASMSAELVDNGSFEEIVLVPHIFRDLAPISNFMNLLPDKVVRDNVVVAELGLGCDLARFKDYYIKSHTVLGTRFHSNIAGIASGAYTLGLANYRQISKLYSELKLESHIIDVRQQGFKDELLEKIEFGLTQQTNPCVAAAKNQKQAYDRYAQRLSEFFTEQFS